MIRRLVVCFQKSTGHNSGALEQDMELLTSVFTSMCKCGFHFTERGEKSQSLVAIKMLWGDWVKRALHA